MRVLTISTLYPNRSQPVHALFVEQRIVAMSQRFPVAVVCPIPWFPLAGRLARYRHRRRIPRREVRQGVNVSYPRFLSVPRFLKPLDGVFVLLTCLVEALRMRRGGFAFDRIDAHLAFPDGWAGVLLGRVFRVPVSITLRGHDINDLPRFPVRRRQVQWALARADVVFAVADALRRGAVALGAPPSRAITVGNGVDPQRFGPLERGEARRRLGLPDTERIVLSVGHLVERKGFHHLIRALPVLLRTHPEARLVIVGGPGEEGDFSARLAQAAEESGARERITWVGAVPHEELALWYCAADVFCLASENEGRANVLLEALACGTPIVATEVWGTPEVVSGESLGTLVRSVEPGVLAPAIAGALERRWDREAIVAHSRRFSWAAAARSVEEALERAGGGRR
jgi:glycosyltransferase involved in cell wall biosynthesis